MVCKLTAYAHLHWHTTHAYLHWYTTRAHLQWYTTFGKYFAHTI